MPYAVSYRAEDGIVYVTVSGKATTKDHLAARDEALRLCEQHGCSRMLVNLRDLECISQSLLGSFEFGESIASSPCFVRIAHVLPRVARARERVEFTSTVEANRGKPTREFETADEAKGWLLSVASPAQ